MSRFDLELRRNRALVQDFEVRNNLAGETQRLACLCQLSQHLRSLEIQNLSPGILRQQPFNVAAKLGVGPFQHRRAALMRAISLF